MNWLLALLWAPTVMWSPTGVAMAADSAEVAKAVRDAWTASGGSLVLCAAGGDAERELARITKSDADLEGAPIVKIPILGDMATESERIRVEKATQCALWLQAGSDFGWTVGQTGPCVPVEGPPAALQVATETQANLNTEDGDPTEAPAEGTQPVALAPAPAPRPVGPAVNIPPKLVLADLNADPQDVDAVRWHIVDEKGVSWSTYRFAETMGDTEQLAVLEAELKTAKTTQKVLFWTGIGLVALSPVPLLAADSRSFERNQDLAWTSIFIASTGAMTFAIHKRDTKSTRRRQLRPAHYYTRADSGAYIDAYNTRIDLMREVAEAAAAAPAEEPAAPPPTEGGPVGSPEATPEAPAVAPAVPAEPVPDVPAVPAEQAPDAPAEVPAAPPAPVPDVPAEAPAVPAEPAPSVPAPAPAPEPEPQPDAAPEPAPPTDAAPTTGGGDQ